MVPVELRLKNFLSYGTDAPPLDFDRFHVACLSGGNGQGKSALLDAVTWAVWGEARKSAGNRKPDDELIRIGTQEMEVTLVFDVEGERYRVTRSYYRSATGKTTRPGLEFQIYEPQADRYRPLTGGNMRETQQQINGIVGLDYDTFINSAFLLQGRSDEFTKKRPSERKEILTKVLNLGRYEELTAKAREHWSAAKAEQERADAEVGRLEGALEEVPAWKEEREAVAEEIEKKRESLRTLREQRQELTGRLASLETQEQEAASIEASIEKLDGRRRDYREEADELEERIERADALLKKSDQIQRDYSQYEQLQQEREALEEKRDQHRTLERQIDQCRSEMKDKKNEAEKRLHRLEVEQTSDRRTLEELAGRLEQEATVREKIEEAEKAQDRLESLREARERRQALADEVEQIGRELLGKRQSLSGRIDSLRQQIEEDKKGLVDGELEAEVDRLKDEKQRLDGLLEEQKAIREKGQRLSEALKEQAGQLGAREEELAREEAKLERLRDAEEGRCPTCGTELTPAHRREVEGEQAGRIEALEAALHEEKTALAEETRARDQLRASFRTLSDRIEVLEKVPEKLIDLRGQLRRGKKQKKTLARRKKEAERLEKKIEEKQYGEEQRARRKALKEKIDAIAFDEETFEKTRRVAGQLEGYREKLGEIQKQSRRKETLEENVERREENIDALREKLDDGAIFGDLPARISGLEDKLEKTGFNSSNFKEVRRKIKALSDAPGQMKDLVHAQENRTAWKKQRERQEERIEKAKQERKQLEEKRDRLREALEEKPTLEKRQARKTEECEALDGELNDLQGRRGELDERLKKAERDRSALKERREELKEARSRRTLYKHLKGAFSKNGIPSLIIEETLPDIEDRANRILDRLTEGRMHVRLETLADKKSGGTRETLEINISDDQGVTRAYETYSGGEGFRVNFALRIALAQLLAERSGVRVRTLIIDEGFGTQDKEGLQNLVEAVQTVKGDFEKIIVITHLDELKSAFPARIEVEKDPALGSTFEMAGM